MAIPSESHIKNLCRGECYGGNVQICYDYPVCNNISEVPCNSFNVYSFI